MTTEQQLNELAGIIGGNAWGANLSKHRIYLNLRRKDAKAFVSFADTTETEIQGAVTVVTINDCGQSAKWYASQKAQIRDGFRREFAACVAYTRVGAAAAQAVMDDEDTDFDDDAAFDAMCNELVNS